MNSPDNADWTNSPASDEHLEGALRAEAEWLSAQPAPDAVPRVLETIRSLKNDTPAEPASPVLDATPTVRRRVAASLTWLGLAAAAIAGIVLWVESTGELDPLDARTAPELITEATPRQDAPILPPQSGDPAAMPHWLAGLPLGASLHAPPLQQIAPWLADEDSPLLSREVEQPLLDELGGMRRDAERAAAAVIEPLLRALLELQLRPSVQAANESLGR